MHKYFILSLIVSIIPNLCLAENPRITKLMREKQAKMEQLEKCMGSSKGLKIAGISTLGLTAVGVAGNIAEAKVIQDYNDRIESTDKNIEKTKIEIQEKRDALDAKEEAEAKRIAAEEQAKREGRILRKVALEDIARINSSGYNGDKAVSHGYMPERLPDGLRSQFANAMVNFIARCRSLIGQYGIEDVSLSQTEQENWRQYLGGTPLAEDTVLDDLNEHIIAECKIIKCNEKTHTLVNDGYGVRCDAKSATPQKTTTPGNATTPADKSSTPENKTTPGDENTPTQPTVVADDTDCITEAKKKDSDAKTAKYKNGVCKITACNNLSKQPSNDGQKCVVRPAAQWTDMEKRLRPNEFCNRAYSSDESRACCLEIYKNNKATSWNESKKECVCTNGFIWQNKQCVMNLFGVDNTVSPTLLYDPTKPIQTTPKTATKPKAEKTNDKDLSNKVIYYTRMMNKAQTTNFEHNGSQIVVSAYDALDASGNKMNCPSTADGLSNCARVALEQKIKSLGYTNFKIVKY